ncbi:hypothetical protein PVK06_031273 [Gossypium arboreum]|uniref:NB-ARC domain-containing protein n=1 Tax=Gossypium arboreum TaxID=29729 RepID=A0ABR0NQV1_GOSAR|nr:hypothetical protein PVK06_031273 [Gossypium arboreum]
MAEEPQRTIISVVGMGGSGKTTLVANTFNKQSVKQHFEFCSWITVSQQYAIEELFRSMVKDIYKQKNEEVPMHVDTMTYRALLETCAVLAVKKVPCCLRRGVEHQFWQEISIAFPEGMCGSRVMVTTRREDVAPLQPTFVSYVHRILPLRDNDAWEFFCKKAFPNELGWCQSHLDSLARNLVEKCEGLPLAIATLGGMKSSKKSISEWKRVRDNLAWELSNNPSLELMRTILLLTYHNPPFQLKHFSLYSLLPEDYEIRRNRISRLWMAGVLEMGNDILPEAVAKSYIMELISRKESFLAACDGEKGEEQRGNHRCSIQVKDKEIKTGNGTSQLRSLIIFVVDETCKFNELPSGLKLLRVLDLEDAPIDELPKERLCLVEGFKKLQYLNLRQFPQQKEIVIETRVMPGLKDSKSSNARSRFDCHTDVRMNWWRAYAEKETAPIYTTHLTHQN